MTLQGQLSQSQQPPAFFEMAGMLGPSSDPGIGLLWNEAIQTPVRISDPHDLLAEYKRLFASAQPSLRLALLKKQRFTPAERAQRTVASLAALNAPQPTSLTLGQWKEIVEEIEDED